MPNFSVFIHETSVYKFYVRAEDEIEAQQIALDMHDNISQSPESMFIVPCEVVPVSDEAEVYN